MRLLHRHDDDLHDDDVRDRHIDTRDPDTHDERAHRRSVFRRPVARDDRDATLGRDQAAFGREREIESERARDERQEEIVERRKRWDTFGFLTAAYGAALAAMGAVALVRTGVDESWYRPVTEVAGVRQSPLMGAIELGAGALLVLALLLGLRMFAALVALAGGVAATVVALEPSLVNPELAIQRGWAVALAASSLALGLLLIATRDRRRERRVVHRPVTA